MDNEVNWTGRVWTTGNSPVITLPLSVRNILGIEKGDYIECTIRKVIKKENTIIKVQEGKERDYTAPVERRELPSPDLRESSEGNDNSETLIKETTMEDLGLPDLE